ncbi:MAG: hypothetical protein NDJ19_09685 [Ramlibacter sp.]|nr:hypothetical protein [Ramlibacter sp.]
MSSSGELIPQQVFDAILRQHEEPARNEGAAKVLPLSEAVASLVKPGMSLYTGFGHARAHAAAFEIIRRFWGRDPQFHLISAGVLEAGLIMVYGHLVNRVTAAYGGNTYPVPGPNRVFREAVTAGRIALEEVTNLTITTRLMAGAMGLPFIPTRSVSGTGLATAANGYREVADPFARDGAPVGVLQALRPDLAVVHAYAADASGNAILLGPYGEEAWGAFAAKGGVLLTVEKLVSTEFIRQHAHLVRIPGHIVRSVSVAPFGAHPQPMTNFGLPEAGGYGEDYEFRRTFKDATRSDAALDEWISRHVLDCPDHAAYVEQLGTQRVQALQASFHPQAWRAVLAARHADISRDAASSDAETMIIVAAREIMRSVRSRGHKTVLAGAGVANLAAWLAVSALKADGVDVELMAEAGFFGYAPRFGDPYLFSVANMFSNKMHAGFVNVLGLLAGGSANRCLAVIGAGQVDRQGNINSTRQSDGSFLVGSGGANDLGNSASELLVLCTASPRRLVDAVPYVTTSGRHVRTLVTQLGVFEKAAADAPFKLARLVAPRRPGSPDQVAKDLASSCGWSIDPPAALVSHDPITQQELATLRLFDPERIFTA